MATSKAGHHRTDAARSDVPDQLLDGDGDGPRAGQAVPGRVDFATAAGAAIVQGN